MYEIREMPTTIECAFIRYIAVKQCFDSFHFRIISELLNMQNDHQGNDMRLARFQNSLSITKKAVTLEFKMYYHFDNKAIIGSESKKDCYVISHFKLNAKSGRGRCRKKHSGCICVIRCSIGT